MSEVTKGYAVLYNMKR